MNPVKDTHLERFQSVRWFRDHGVEAARVARWTCPVCSKPLRPDDVLLDPFAQGILDTLRGDEDLVEAVVFNENCTWSTVSAVKADENKEAENGEGEKPSAEMIDLSDDE